MSVLGFRLSSAGERHRAKYAVLCVAGAVVALGIGIVIGTRIASPRSSRPVIRQHAASPTGAAQAPGRRASAGGAQTRAGAVAAAARSITAFAGNVLLDPSRLRAVVSHIASTESRAQLTQAFAEASAQTRAKLGADTTPRPVIVLRAIPVGYRVEQYSPVEATIAVWYVGIVGSGATVQLQQSWRTQTVSLVWQAGGWKVSTFASSAGPTPALVTTEAEAPGDLFAVIPRFKEFAYGAR